jgi:hypothetical protein
MMRALVFAEHVLLGRIVEHDPPPAQQVSTHGGYSYTIGACRSMIWGAVAIIQESPSFKISPGMQHTPFVKRAELI